MAWNLIAPNTWSNSKSPYLIKFDSITNSFIVEDIDGKNFIPLDDIFNNPAFPADFGNIPVLGKHFRAEGANTPTTPGFSFQGDINTGFFRKSEDTVGFSAGGIQYGEFGVGYGGFTGNIIQVQSTTKSDTFSSSGTSSFEDITGLNVVITPKYSNSKILILALIMFGGNFWDNVLRLNLLRNGSNIMQPSGGSSASSVTARAYTTDSISTASFTMPVNLSFLDSPNSLSALTYKIQGRVAANTWYVNRWAQDTSLTSVSTITAMEIQQ